MMARGKTKVGGCLQRMANCKWRINYYEDNIKNPPTPLYPIDEIKSLIQKEKQRFIELKKELENYVQKYNQNK